MANKTAMQLLIEYLDAEIKNAIIPEQPIRTEKIANPFIQIKAKAISLRDKEEREQLALAVDEMDNMLIRNDVIVANLGSLESPGNQYYTTKYKTNE